jgi:23S rRNA pseudouridine955/2504/2580 synthase
MLTYRITEKDHCRSIESFLRNLFPVATPGYLHQLLKSGHIRHNDGQGESASLLLLNDQLAIKESGRTRALLARSAPVIDILFEDDQILVVNKEPGLAVHKAAEDRGRNLVALAEKFLAIRQIECKLRPVNRIDLGTSGSVILAKSSTSAGIFGRYVKETGLGKTYLAAVEGMLATEGVIDLPLDNKESLTSYRLLFQGETAAIVALYPVSGRMHQIRRHLAAIGNPVVGDRRYGGANLAAGSGHALHAFAVSLEHPVSGAKMIIHAPLPESLLDLFRKISGNSFPTILASLPDLALPCKPAPEE